MDFNMTMDTKKKTKKKKIILIVLIIILTLLLAAVSIYYFFFLNKEKPKPKPKEPEVVKKLQIVNEDSNARPIAVMIDNNVGDSLHKGLQDAYITYEAIVEGSLSRIFEFGGDTPELVVINLVVSDGDPSRGQRQSLLNPGVKKIGIANGIHNMYGHCTVLISATEFKSNDGGEDNRFLDGEYVPNLEINNDNEIEEGVIKITKTESYITENGKKKKITKIIKHMENGTKQIETIKENAD